MKKLFLFSLFILASSIISAHSSFQSTRQTALSITHGQGLSAFFSGMVDGNVVVAGGSNFPDVPCAKGGTKRSYNEIRTLNADGRWKITGYLPHPVSNGAGVTTSEGLFCSGGMNGNEIYKSTFLITKDSLRLLPDMPFALRDHACAVYNDKVYVVGGLAEQTPNLKVLAFDLKQEGATWEEVAELPNGGRVQCATTIQTGVNGPCLYVISGYDVVSDVVTARTDGVYLDLATCKWGVMAPLPNGATLTGSTCSNSGYSHILCVGGVNKKIFEDRMNGQHSNQLYFSHAPEWYQFNDLLWAYHTITDTWHPIFKSSSFALAGAGLVNVSPSQWMLIDGEIKPGIRSSHVAKLSLSHSYSFGTVNWIILICYLLGMLLLGYIFMKREAGADDFFKGGGRIPWWAAGISIYATMISALTYMGIPAKAYATNWTYYPILVTIVLVSIPVIKYYLPYFRKLNITSAYEYLEIRFNAATRLMASALFIVFMVARMALVLYIPSLALSAVTGIDVQHCIILMSTVTSLYGTRGGIEAVVWGDVIQGAILVGGALLLAGWLVFHTEGGVGGYLNIGASHDKFRLFEWSLDYRNVTFWVAIIGGFANNLISCTSDQTYIQRYLTTKDEKGAARSIWMNSILCVCIGIVFYIIGTGLYTFYQTHPSEVDITMSTGDAIVPYFMMSQMPQGVAGLLIAAIFAATMSTLSSNINSISTAFCIDFWKKLRPAVDDKSMVRVARVSGILAGGVGLCLALLMTTWNILSLVDYFNTILGLLTGGLGGLFFIGVFMPRVGGKAALGGFVCGTVFVFWMKCFTDANLFLYGASGLVVSALVAWILSLFLKGDAPRAKM